MILSYITYKFPANFCPLLCKAAWLSWLKRLSSKQEIPCSNHGAASFFFFNFFSSDHCFWYSSTFPVGILSEEQTAAEFIKCFERISNPFGLIFFLSLIVVTFLRPITVPRQQGWIRPRSARSGRAKKPKKQPKPPIIGFLICFLLNSN